MVRSSSGVVPSTASGASGGTDGVRIQIRTTTSNSRSTVDVIQDVVRTGRSNAAPDMEAAMRAASTPEYDAFGPWIMSVSSQEQVPPVFRAHPIDFASAHDVLKVPRDIARRDATPRSHLYDFLLILDSGGVEVLARQGHRFSVQRIARDSIAAVDSGTELLAGWLSILGTDGTRIDVGFNGASLPTITAFADRLVGWNDPEFDDAPVLDALDRDTLGYHDVGLVNAYNSLPHHGGTRRVTAAYPETTPISHRSRLSRSVRGEEHVSGAVVASDDDHAIVLTRAEWVRRSRKPDLSLRRIVIPNRAVTSTSVAPHPFLDDVVDLTVHCGTALLELTVPRGETHSVEAPFDLAHG
jgi:hypothetical protein